MLGGWALMPHADAYRRAEQAASRAIELDESLAEPHATLGYFKTLYEWDWPGAEREFQRAIELNPEYGTAHHWYAFYLLTVGSAPQALASMLRAREVDPLSPIINAEVAYFHLYARKYEQAVREAQKALELDSAFFPTYWILGNAYALQGKRRETKAAIEEALRLSQGEWGVMAFGGSALAFAGYSDEARKLLEEITQLAETRYIFPAAIGILHASLGEKERAFGYFEQALDERSIVVSWLRDPMLDDLAAEPRFRKIFERMGLRP